MRHRMRGRKLGRNPSHRKAMFRNMAASLIRSVRTDPDDPEAPKVPGRIVTTLPKAKELRPIVEKLITLARKSLPHEERAREFATDAERNSDEWQSWRNSDQWQQWAAARAPVVGLRRRAFSLLRDKDAVEILFEDLAPRFEDRPGGYTRVVRLAEVRLGDAGRKAFIEFVGERDRIKQKRRAPVVEEEEQETTSTATAEDESAEDQTDESTDAGQEEDIELRAEGSDADAADAPAEESTDEGEEKKDE